MLDVNKKNLFFFSPAPLLQLKTPIFFQYDEPLIIIRRLFFKNIPILFKAKNITFFVLYVVHQDFLLLDAFLGPNEPTLELSFPAV